MPTRPISITIPEDLLIAVDRRAVFKKVSRSVVFRDLVIAHVDDWQREDVPVVEPETIQ